MMACRTGFLYLSSTLTSIINNNSLYNVKAFYSFLCNFYIHKRLYSTADIMFSSMNESSFKIEKINIDYKIKADDKFNKCTSESSNEINKVKELYDNTLPLTYDKINKLVGEAIESKKMGNIKYYTNYCIKNEKMPSQENLVKLFIIFSNDGNIAVVKSLQNLCSKKFPKVSLNNYNFNYYLARAHWAKGNVEEAFIIYYDVFENNSNMKTQVRLMLKYIISEIVAKSSEASIVIAKKHTLKFAEKLNDWSLLTYFCENCMLSEWYRDQQLAEELFNEHEMVRELLSYRVAVISSYALKNNSENLVLNLLELLLKYKMLRQYSLVIATLFDYKYKRDDINGCTEIIKNCKSLNIKLTDIHYEKYLFMKITTDKLGFELKQLKKTKKPIVEFKYKF